MLVHVKCFRCDWEGQVDNEDQPCPECGNFNTLIDQGNYEEPPKPVSKDQLPPGRSTRRRGKRGGR